MSTTALSSRLLRSGARCLQAVAGLPYQACLQLLRDPDTPDERALRLRRLLESIARQEHGSDDGTLGEFNELVGEVVAARSSFQPAHDGRFDSLVTPLPQGRIAVHWSFNWSEIEVLAEGDEHLLATVPTGLRRLPDDPYLAACKTVESLERAARAGDEVRVAERVEAAITRLTQRHEKLTGNALLWLLDDEMPQWQLDMSEVARLDGEAAGDIPTMVIAEVSDELNSLGSVLGAAPLGLLAGLSYGDVVAVRSGAGPLQLHTTAGPVGEVGTDPWAQAAGAARYRREAVELRRNAPPLLQPLVWAIATPCICPCHVRRLTRVDERDWHGYFFGQACPCEQGFNHVDIDQVQFGDEVISGDEVRRVAAARWVMDGYDGSGVVQLDYAEDPASHWPSESFPDEIMVWTRR